MCFIIFILLLVIVIAVFVVCKRSANHKKPDYHLENVNTKPKIGSEVSYCFYNEIKQYCYKHHMSISDLIRKAVRIYMDTNT